MIRYNADNNAVEGYVNGSWQNFSVSATGFQPLDADLTALAALSTTGLISRTGSGTVATRTLTAPAAGITVSNDDGVSGNPTLALSNDLAAVEALASTGIPVRTAADTWTTRSLAQPASGFTITNADGVSGNPTFALTGDLLGVENLGSLGLAVRTAANTWTTRTIVGTTNQIIVTDGVGGAGNPTITMASNPVVPGNGAITIPSGTIAQRPTPTVGMIRYNSETGYYEVYQNGAWRTLLASQSAILTAQLTGQDGATSEPLAFIFDTTRSKNLSIETAQYVFSDNSMASNDFILIASNLNAAVGYVLPYDGTIIRITAYSNNGNGSSKNMSVYLDDTEFAGQLTIGAASNVPVTATNTDVNIDFSAGNLLRLRARAGSGGSVLSPAFSVFVKWRV